MKILTVALEKYFSEKLNFTSFQEFASKCPGQSDCGWLNGSDYVSVCKWFLAASL